MGQNRDKKKNAKSTEFERGGKVKSRHTRDERDKKENNTNEGLDDDNIWESASIKNEFYAAAYILWPVKAHQIFTST
jgi:hypothetical protein